MRVNLRLGIGAKLFMAIFATCMLVLITMHWGVRLSFEHGFVDYIKRGNEQRLNLLSDALADQYEQHGNWDFLRHNDRLVFTMLRSLEQNPDSNSQLPPHGWRTQFWILDQQYKVMVGPRAPVPPEGTRRNITTSTGKVVGWVIGSPPERLTRSTDINFDQQQRRTSWIIVGLSTLLAALATWLMARGLLAPVKRLVDGTHHLAAGNFATRVEVSSRDELGQLAGDFNLLASSLEKNESMRRAFMADISHELRTPLAILRGELEAMQDGVRKLTPDAIASLQSEVVVLTKLVEDLHQLSLSDVGALAYRKQATDLVQLLEVTAGSFAERYRAHGLTLKLNLPDHAPFFGDPDRLIQLFTNLLENSLRYTDSGGRVEVTLKYEAPHWHIEFDDSAPGVDREHQVQIFERFFRTEGSRNRASGGSGLGLAICKNIADAHGGDIHAAHSDLGGLKIALHLRYVPPV
ncbi:two-component system sensor histidine kinase BaeS [Pantoea sp. Bo_2]|uniref:histidine kinase n=1 Tax=Candidatus Pantoea gossypiicola TaxID=2608008 RepID=A0AB34CNT8_9GAMM|nr:MULTISPECIES: two-component system sensor histidine kinase BaeS [Pantoea]KAA5933516.1 two-component system sensor histidine kinase BaeS [Pantoea sp. VH_8]KAA5938415.1 two-component system sensor histidine kinase BaeS [Pantoea sp. VH_4]KAA5949745.1 two-component system sensor histidine kinase BaeS [Pantoea sp. VH_3]KAA5953379.1 two-component system sensor histidine kinase BaeS [Pantoea sp. VH_24]KAA5954083.1 two-component system sensor histidine kinase BaeS [Pantoea sp. VH_25]